MYAEKRNFCCLFYFYFQLTPTSLVWKSFFISIFSSLRNQEEHNHVSINKPRENAGKLQRRLFHVEIGMLYTHSSFNYRNVFLKVDRFYSTLHRPRHMNNASESRTASLCGTYRALARPSLLQHINMWLKNILYCYFQRLSIYLLYVRKTLSHPDLLQYNSIIHYFHPKTI